MALWRRSVGFSSRVASPFSKNVIYSDNHLIVYNKPPGILSQKDRTNDADIKELCLAWLQETRNTKYASVVHRLDRPCSGAIMIAVSSKAASRLSKSLANGSVSKSYCVVVHDSNFLLRSEQGWLIDALRQAPDNTNKARRTLCKNLATFDTEPSDEQLSQFKNSIPLDSQLAALHYTMITRYQGLALIIVTLAKTGRRHQIRAQLAARGAPIFGDAKYGSGEISKRSNNRIGQKKISACIALHCVSLTSPHPIADRPPINVIAPIPRQAWGKQGLDLPVALLDAAHEYIETIKEKR